MARRIRRSKTPRANGRYRRPARRYKATRRYAKRSTGGLRYNNQILRGAGKFDPFPSRMYTKLSSDYILTIPAGSQGYNQNSVITSNLVGMFNYFPDYLWATNQYSWPATAPATPKHSGNLLSATAYNNYRVMGSKVSVTVKTADPRDNGTICLRPFPTSVTPYVATSNHASIDSMFIATGARQKDFQYGSGSRTVTYYQQHSALEDMSKQQFLFEPGYQGSYQNDPLANIGYAVAWRKDINDVTQGSMSFHFKLTQWVLLSNYAQ